MTNAAIEVIAKRRTRYAIGRNLTQSQESIEALIRQAIRLAPTSFNSQSSRAVILFGDASLRFWNIVTEALRAIVPAEQFDSTQAKMDRFAAGVGTVLFYEDQATVKDLQEKFPLYADNFPDFSEQSGGMAQFAVWTALASAGIGASLQHYHPLIDDAVAREFDIPESWKLRAQMPFGSIEAKDEPKSFIDDALRFRSHGNLTVAAE
ncbi:MAG: nitroreductase family protein [Pseudorhodobacter sp.]